MWTPLHFAIYYQRLEIVKMLLSEFTSNFILSLRLPPMNETTEYIIPAVHNATLQLPKRRLLSNESFDDEVGLPSTNFAEIQKW